MATKKPTYGSRSFAAGPPLPGSRNELTQAYDSAAPVLPRRVVRAGQVVTITQAAATAPTQSVSSPVAAPPPPQTASTLTVQDVGAGTTFAAITSAAFGLPVTLTGTGQVQIVASYFGDTPPPNPVQGALWYDTLTSAPASTGTGTQGPKGDTGATGPAGATGATGAAGPAGAKGDTGAAGAQGVQGVKGDTGAAGPAGATGPMGATGTAGPAGSTGAAGAQGSPGTPNNFKDVPSGTTYTNITEVDFAQPLTQSTPGKITVSPSYVGPTAPANPVGGELWYDTSTQAAAPLAAVKVKVVSAAYAFVLNADTFIVGNTTGGTFAIKLPDPSLYNGPTLAVGCTGTGGAAASVTTDGTGKTITGSTSVPQGSTREYAPLADGSGWWQF